MVLSLKRETKYASPGANQQHYQIIFDDGQTRRSIGRVINVLLANNVTVFRWGILRMPHAEENSGSADDLQGAMQACRRRWDSMPAEVQHDVVHRWGRKTE